MVSRWQIRLSAAGAGLDVGALHSLVPLVARAPIRAAGREVGHVREPVIVGRELFALATIEAEAFEMQLHEWARRGILQTAAGLCIIGRRVPVDQGEGEPSAVYTAVRSVDVIEVPRGPGCFLWRAESAAGAELPGLSAPVARPWKPRPARGHDPAGALRRRFARGRPAVSGTAS